MNDDEDKYEESDELFEDDDTVFKIENRLQAPDAVQYTTRQLFQLIHEGVIELNPPYQRDVVWPESKMIRLLDSIYRNFYVPPIVFVQDMGSDGQILLRCVDGKQRLTSIQKFFDGHIPYKTENMKAYWYTVSAASATKKLEVPKEWKEDFAAKKVTCIKYASLPPGYERDIFQRVQLGMPLTAAEKLQAISSPWADWIADLDKRMMLSDTGLSYKIKIDMNRGRHFQVLAMLVCCCDGIPVRTTPSAPKLEAFVSRRDGPKPKFKRDINDVLTTLWHMADQPHLNMGFSRFSERVAPVEFVFIGVLLYVLQDCDEKDRAQAIFEMRDEARKTFPGNVKTNTKLASFFWNFIAEVAEKFDSGVYIEPASTVTKRVRKKRQRQPDPDKTFATPSTAKKARNGKSRA